MVWAMHRYTSLVMGLRKIGLKIGVKRD